MSVRIVRGYSHGGLVFGPRQCQRLCCHCQSAEAAGEKTTRPLQDLGRTGGMMKVGEGNWELIKIGDSRRLREGKGKLCTHDMALPGLVLSLS